jgi:hypothetical protein
LNLRDLTEKARSIEADHRHRFSQNPREAHSSFPSPSKDRSTGVYYFACLDCRREVYLIGDQILGTAIDGGRCEGEGG